MKSGYSHVVLFFLSLITLLACNRKDGDSSDVGGKGGNAILRITPKHHTDYIDSCMVYIKYNVSDAPATANYDDSTRAILISGMPVATFSGLKKGNYYLFGKGWDPSILQNVKGGIPYTITEEKTIDLTLPVTEDH